jgi:hypothetical protein
MGDIYVKPYVSGAVTRVGWSVVCVPQMKAVEVVEPLASRLATLIVQGKVTEAQTLLRWFGGGYAEAKHDIETEEPLPI